MECNVPVCAKVWQRKALCEPTAAWITLAELFARAKISSTPIHFVRSKGAKRIVCCIFFLQRLGVFLRATEDYQQTPSLFQGLPHSSGASGRETPAPIGGAPRPCLRSRCVLGAARKPRASLQALRTGTGVLINMRESQRAPRAPRFRGAAQKPRRRRLLNPCRILTFPKLETRGPQPFNH